MGIQLSKCIPTHEGRIDDEDDISFIKGGATRKAGFSSNNKQNRREVPQDETHKLMAKGGLGTMLRCIECPICLDVFNNEENLPCTLACGHSICMHHINSIRSCPICRCRVSRRDKLRKSIQLAEAAAALVAHASIGSSLQDELTTNKSPNGNIDIALQCPICWMPFDDGLRVPCTPSNCGHSFCLQHDTELKSRCCPICREPFRDDCPLVVSPVLAEVSRKLQTIRKVSQQRELQVVG